LLKFNFERANLNADIAFSWYHSSMSNVNSATEVGQHGNAALVEEVRAIASRLRELGFHDESYSLTTSANMLAKNKIVLSTVALAEKVAQSLVLDELAKKLKQDSVKRQSNANPYDIADKFLAVALVEVVTLNGGVIDRTEAYKLVARRMNVSLSLMRYARTIACDSGKLKYDSDTVGTLQLA